MNKIFTLLTFLGLLALCTGAPLMPGEWTTIVLDGQAVTLSAGNPRFLKLEDIRTSDDTQVWAYQDGYIWNKAFPTYVFDVYNGAAADGARVIGYPKKSTVAKNQQWSITNEPRIVSGFGGYYISKRADGFVIISKTPRSVMFQAPLVGPFTCTSWGDPHFVRFDSTQYDFYGVGDFILAEFGQNQVQARQYICNGGVSCNEKIAIKPAGYNGVIVISDNTATVGGVLLSGDFLQITAKVSITRTARGVFRVKVDGGYIDSISYGWHHTYYVTITSGPLAHAGLCQAKPRMVSARNAVRGLHVTRAQEHSFGLTWIVRHANESLFEYNTKTFEEVNQPDYPPNYGPYTTNDPLLLAASAEVCELLFVGEPVTTTTKVVTYTATRRNATLITTVTIEAGLLAAECEDFFVAGAAAKQYKSCVDDVIATGRVTAAQPGLASFATLCFQAATKMGRTVVLPAVGSSSVAAGAGLAAEIMISATPVSFTIWAKDAVGRSLTKGGDMFAVVSEPMLQFTVVDNWDGTYTVSYIPDTLGTYSISVRHKGIDHVIGSPFDVMVKI